jgi:hypothetical protein
MRFSYPALQLTGFLTCTESGGEPEKWNKRYPKGHGWHYESSSDENFWHTINRIKKAIVHPNYNP